MKVTVTGRNYLGALVTRVLIDENLPRPSARWASDMDIGDDMAYDPVEFVDAKTLQYFPRQLVSRPWSVVVTHEFSTSFGALQFWLDLRQFIPEQADLVIEEGSMRRQMRGVIVHARPIPPRIGKTVKVRYEFMGGDFVV